MKQIIKYLSSIRKDLKSSLFISFLHPFYNNLVVVLDKCNHCDRHKPPVCSTSPLVLFQWIICLPLFIKNPPPRSYSGPESIEMFIPWVHIWRGRINGTIFVFEFRGGGQILMGTNFKVFWKQLSRIVNKFQKNNELWQKWRKDEEKMKKTPLRRGLGWSQVSSLVISA